MELINLLNYKIINIYIHLILIHTFIIEINKLSWIFLQALMLPYAKMKDLIKVATEFMNPINV